MVRLPDDSPYRRQPEPEPELILIVHSPLHKLLEALHSFGEGFGYTHEALRKFKEANEAAQAARIKKLQVQQARRRRKRRAK